MKKKGKIKSLIIIMVIGITFIFSCIFLLTYDFTDSGDCPNNDETVDNIELIQVKLLDNISEFVNKKLLMLEWSTNDYEFNQFLFEILDRYKESNNVTGDYLFESNNLIVEKLWLDFGSNEVTVNFSLLFNSFIKYRTIIRVNYKLTEVSNAYIFYIRSFQVNKLTLPNYIVRSLLNNNGQLSTFILSVFKELPIGDVDHKTGDIIFKKSDIVSSIESGYIGNTLIKNLEDQLLFANLATSSFNKDIIKIDIDKNKGLVFSLDINKFLTNDRKYPTHYQKYYLLADEELDEKIESIVINKRLECLLLNSNYYYFSDDEINLFLIREFQKKVNVMDVTENRIHFDALWIETGVRTARVNYVFSMAELCTKIDFNFNLTTKDENQLVYRLSYVTIGYDEGEIESQYYATMNQADLLSLWRLIENDSIFRDNSFVLGIGVFREYFDNNGLFFATGYDKIVLTDNTSLDVDFSFLFQESFYSGLENEIVKRALIDNLSIQEVIRILQAQSVYERKEFIIYLLDYANINGLVDLNSAIIKIF